MKPLDAINRLIVHHSASPLNTTAQQIRRWHETDNGWDDIGYHFIILRGGTIAKARPLPNMGAHAKGANFDSIGVCVVGNNLTITDGWVPAQVDSLHTLWSAIRTVFPGIELVGHRDVATGTECPGLDVRTLMFGPNATPSGVR